MDEDKSRLWDVRIKIAGAFFTLATILIGLVTFFYGQRASIELEANKRTADIELEAQKRRSEAEYAFKRALWETKRQSYQESAKVIGQLSSTTDASTFAHLKRIFFTDYFGQLILVEDQGVNKLIASYKSVLETIDPNIPEERARLNGLSHPLVGAMRKSIESDLKALGPTTNTPAQFP